MEAIDMSRGSLLRPLLLPESDIVSLVSELYGLQVEFLRELASYDDRNYLVEEVLPWSAHQNPKSVRPRTLILKVLNAKDSLEPLKINIQNEVILFAKQAGYPLPAPLANVEGNYQKLMSFENKTRGITETSLVRLFEYVPGTTLEKVKLTKPLCREIGHYAGWLDKICQKFLKYDESTYKILKRDWNLSQVSCLWSQLDVIKDRENRSIVSGILSTFEEEVLKNEDKFSKGYIHSDINDCNLIVSRAADTPKDCQEKQNGVNENHVTESNGTHGTESNGTHGTESNGDQVTESNDTEDEAYHIAAVIDFGDISFTCHLFEVAIAICYVLINKSGIPPLEAAGCVLSGYLKHIQLSDWELQHLKTCVCTRLAQSIVMGLNTLKANPENIYNLFHSSRMWEPMRNIWAMSDKEFLQKLSKEMD